MKTKTVRISEEAHKRLKTGASRRKKKMNEHINDLSKLAISIVDVKWKQDENTQV